MMYAEILAFFKCLLDSLNLLYVLFLIENEFIVSFRVQHMVYLHFPQHLCYFEKASVWIEALIYHDWESQSS